jgi:DNA-directed RNA polymerase alpha subunit
MAVAPMSDDLVRIRLSLINIYAMDHTERTL